MLSFALLCTRVWGINLARHIFGGPDTPRKLRCLREYLTAFSIALRNQQFACVYIDAFAGSGSRTEVRPALPLLGEEFAEPQEVTTPGSARIAIDTDPPLHSIVLIEEDASRFAELERLAAEYPDREIILEKGDANTHVQNLCTQIAWRQKESGLRGTRGVIFLDPYGMEVLGRRSKRSQEQRLSTVGISSRCLAYTATPRMTQQSSMQESRRA